MALILDIQRKQLPRSNKRPNNSLNIPEKTYSLDELKQNKHSYDKSRIMVCSFYFSL